MEYASSVWTGASPTSLARLDAIQRRAVEIIGVPSESPLLDSIQPLQHRREVGALTLFHRMYHGAAPDLLVQMLPPPAPVTRTTRRSTSRHSASLVVPHAESVGHSKTFLPSTTNKWNCLPEDIIAIKDRQKFKREVNTFLGADCQRSSHL